MNKCKVVIKIHPQRVHHTQSSNMMLWTTCSEIFIMVTYQKITCLVHRMMPPWIALTSRIFQNFIELRGSLFWTAPINILISAFDPESQQWLAHLICIWILRHHTHGAKHLLLLQRFRDMVFTMLRPYAPGSINFLTQESSLSINMDPFIQLFLMTMTSHKNSSVHAQDIVDYVQLPDIQEKLGGSGLKSKISLQTAQWWLWKLGWRYGRKRNGMYIDRHEWEDVVKYWKAFVRRWAEYKKHMTLHDNNRNTVSILSGFAVEQVGHFTSSFSPTMNWPSLLMINVKTHGMHWVQNQHLNESVKGSPWWCQTFCHQNGDHWEMMRKGVCSPFNHLLISHPNPGRLRISFGQERTDGYFDNEDLLCQTDRAIVIFESKTKGFITGLWLFDNALGHQKRPENGLSAWKMPKNPHKSWTHVKMVQQCGAPHSRFSIHPFYILKLSTNPYITQMTTRQFPSGSKG